MSLRVQTIAATVMLTCLTGCTAAPLPVAGSLMLPISDLAGGLALQSGAGPAVPAFANAFGGYVGSFTAIGPLGTFERPAALTFVPDGSLYVADGTCIRRIAPDAQGRQTVSTVAGNWTETGTADGTLFQARFETIGAMVGMPDGSLIIADGSRIRRIIFDGHGGGQVTTIAGTGTWGGADGDGAEARFYHLTSLTAAGANQVFAAESNRIRRIDLDPVSGRATVSTFYVEGIFDPEAEDAPYIECVAATPDGVVWASGNGKVRRFRPGADGTGTPDLVVVGTEPSERAGEASWGPFGHIGGLGLLPNGDVAVVAVNGTHHMRRISVGADGQARVSLLARPLTYTGGSVRFGSWMDAGLSSPRQMAVGPKGEIRVLDQTAIRAIDVDADWNGTPRTFAGWPLQMKRQDGPAESTSLHPDAIVPNGRGGYYISVWNALYEMQATAMGGATTRFLAGARTIGKADGVGDQARFDSPNEFLLYSDGSLIVSDYQNHLLRRVTFDADGRATVSTLAGGGAHNFQVQSMTLGDGPARTAALFTNTNLCLSPDGTIYFGDHYRVRKLTRDPDGQWRVTSIAGCSNVGILYKDGPGEQARFGTVSGLAMDRDGALIVADRDNHLIRKLVFDAEGKATVSTIAGNLAGTHPWNTASGFKDGPAAEALFSSPNDVDVAEDGSLLVTDFKNNAIRRVSRDSAGAWHVSTLIGPGEGMVDGPFAQARLTYPYRLVPDGPGRYLCLDGRFPTHQLRTIRLGASQ